MSREKQTLRRVNVPSAASASSSLLHERNPDDLRKRRGKPRSISSPEQEVFVPVPAAEVKPGLSDAAVGALDGPAPGLEEAPEWRHAGAGPDHDHVARDVVRVAEGALARPTERKNLTVVDRNGC